MAKIDCTACEDLRDSAPDYAVNGVTDKVCNYLKNNTGLSGDSDNCTDLDIVNDCTIGMMDSVLDAYDVCEWKDFMHKFIPNIHQYNKAELCALCSLFELQCYLNFILNGFTFHIDEGTDPTTTHIVAGKGVSFLSRGASDPKPVSDIYVSYWGGSLLQGGGALRFHVTDFEDAGECLSFDSSDDPTTLSSHRLGNDVWGTTGVTADGNELIYEIRIKKSEYPYVRAIGGGLGQQTNMGGFMCTVTAFNSGSYAYGQHGSCYTDTGEPGDPGSSHGHLVPDGWIYMQLRMSYIHRLVTNNDSTAVTPRYWSRIRFNPEDIPC